MAEYFCSYMAFKNNVVAGYGDLVFESEVTSGNELLKNIKDRIINDHYKQEGVSIVITALNIL